MAHKITFTMKQARRYADKTQLECAEYLGICRHTYMILEEHPARLTIEQGKQFAQFVGLPVECISFA